MAIARNQPRRVAAFICGNILILTALVVLDPVDLSWLKVVAYVLGTGISTFVAYVIAESIVFQVRTMQPIAGTVVVHELRNSVPILSAMTVPALLTSASLLGWLDPDVALPVAISWIVLRIAALGWVVGHLRRERASALTFRFGVLLALTCPGAAVLKWWLMH
jgi:putative flippase GtrA